MIQPHTTPSALLDLVAERYNVPPHLLLTTQRTYHTTHGRYVYCWLLIHLCGMNVAEIGRLLQRDHSSVLHGIRRIEHLPELLYQAQEIAAHYGPHSPADAAMRLTELTPEQRRQVCAYLECGLLGTRRHDPYEVHAGLRVLAGNAAIRRKVAAWLVNSDCALGRAYWRDTSAGIDSRILGQARGLGMRVAA